jgi:uncharacterized protein YeaO (DUF488 family)
MTLRIVRLGTPRQAQEGLRIGTVRRPPRGVPKSRFATENYYDVWLPELAPSEALVKAALRATTDAEWRAFKRRFLVELAKPPASRLLELLAALSLTTNFSVGCYCEDESRCHRSILREVLEQKGARVTG